MLPGVYPHKLCLCPILLYRLKLQIYFVVLEVGQAISDVSCFLIYDFLIEFIMFI